MPPLHKPHQTVICNEYIGFYKSTYEFSEQQIRQFGLLKYPERLFFDIFVQFLADPNLQ